MDKLVTFRLVSEGVPNLICVEDKGNPYPLHYGKRYSYKHYLVPKDFNVITDAQLLYDMYKEGQATNQEGTIKVAPKKLICKKL